MDFSNFKLSKSVFESINAMGFNEPTPVQAEVIPQALQKKDLIVSAQTGTGKTAAYLLPLIHLLETHKEQSIKALILVPTRELVQQIDQQFQGFAYFSGLESIAIYGGNDSKIWEQQRVAMQKGSNVLIASPGRLLSHINLGYVDLADLEYLILDEADKMLDMGFVEDINKIIGYLPKQRQTMMFSATMPDKIRTLAKKILHKPYEVNISISKPAERIVQVAYLTYDNQKNKLITSLLKDKDLESIIIFASTKSKVKDLTKDLTKEKLKAYEIHSDLTQAEREKVMLDFRNKKFPILVATDIVSRGIDVDNISLVLNYDVPNDAEDYVHRIGRTARAQNSGLAITLINNDDMYKFAKIEELIETEVFKAPNPPEIGKGPEYVKHKTYKKPKGKFRKFRSSKRTKK